MADTGERDVRDRLAEALWQQAVTSNWQWDRDIGDEGFREHWRVKADRFLAALPTVGLRIGRVEE